VAKAGERSPTKAAASSSNGCTSYPGRPLRSKKLSSPDRCAARNPTRLPTRVRRSYHQDSPSATAPDTATKMAAAVASRTPSQRRLVTLWVQASR
jgi:hypothetical protein